MVQMIAVLALPPNDDCNMRVSFESLKGICPFLPLLHPNSLLLDKSVRNIHLSPQITTSLNLGISKILKHNVHKLT